MFNNNKINQLELQISQLKLDKSTLSSELSDLNHKYINLSDKYEYDMQELVNLRKELQSLKQYNISSDIISKQHELSQLQSQIDTINSANYIQTLGFYDLKNDSKYYQSELDANRLQQKLMLSNKSYFDIKEKWIVNNSVKDGTELIEFFLRLCISSFNLTSDSLLSTTNIINNKYITDRLTMIYNNYNKELNKHKVELSSKYLQLKLDEIKIRLNIYISKQNEKEEENRRKEILKEELRCEKEIQISKDKLAKELLHYQIQLNKGADVQDKIDDIEAKIETEDYLLNNNSCGYVYFIKSKSFNDDEYTKVGVTKRINPLERVAELSNASVPFKFYPLAIIFSEQAFDLEHKLHERLDKYRVNKLNTRKEHFKIKDEELLKIVREEFGYDITFDEIVDEDWIYTNNIKGDYK